MRESYDGFSHDMVVDRVQHSTFQCPQGDFTGGPQPDVDPPRAIVGGLFYFPVIP
jgi:hypothetical protein